MLDRPPGFGAGLLGLESIDGSSSGDWVAPFDLGLLDSVLEFGSFVDLRAMLFGELFDLALGPGLSWGLSLGAGLAVGSGAGINV